MRLSWDEFKKMVDDRLAADGKDGSITVGYIKYFRGGRDRVEFDTDAHDEPILQVWNA